MTPEEIAALRSLAEAATPGPWLAAVGTGPKRRKQQYAVLGVESLRGQGEKGALAVFAGLNDRRADDAEFCAAARTAVPALLDALARAEAELAQLRERIKTKADEWDETCRRERSNPTIAHVLRNLLDGPQ